MTLPVPARFESKFEHAIAAQWRARYAEELDEFYRPWVAKDVSVAKLVQATTIPYVPFWSFGERLSVIEEDTSDPLSVNHSLATIAAMLAHRLGETQLLAGSRDEFVGSAQRLANRSTTEPAIFISYQVKDRSAAQRLQIALSVHGFKSLLDADFYTTRERAATIAMAQHMIVILDPPVLRFQDSDIRMFLRQAAVDGTSRILIPIVFGDLDPSNMPPILRNYKTLRLNDGVERVAQQITAILNDASSTSEPELATLLSMRVTNAAGDAIEGVHVRAIAFSGRRIDAVTSADGIAELNLGLGETFTLLFAHPLFLSRVINDFFTPGRRLDVVLGTAHRTGSTIIDGSGTIPGLAGRLTFVSGDNGVARLSAPRLSIDHGAQQPVSLHVGQTFRLEGEDGSTVEADIAFMRGGTWLLKHNQLSQAPGAINQRRRSQSSKGRLQVFLSFHQEGDAWRAKQVANVLYKSRIGVVPGFDAFTWEAAVREGSDAIRRLIIERVQACDCIVVLVGSQTAERHWILEEIKAGWRSEKGIVGIRIDALPDNRGRPGRPGPNPFKMVSAGEWTPLTGSLRLITPEGGNGAAVLSSIKQGIASWIHSAVADRRPYF